MERGSCAYLSLPSTADGDIDWDRVAEDYHRRIMSPLAPEMLGRNPLIEACLELCTPQTTVVDVGCGPGNLVPFLAGRIGRIVGIDRSARALQIAERVAKHHDAPFEPVHADVRALDRPIQGDVVVSVNSVLPPSRGEVVEMFAAMRAIAAPSGTVLMILPSFDTTLYLRNLWVELYRRCTGSDRDAEAIARAFVRTKKLDERTCSYADDGVHPQCYHTPETIDRELAAAGLMRQGEMRKVYYPWEMSRRFDYGFFPGEEEIWDWFVVARPAPQAVAP